MAQPIVVETSVYPSSYDQDLFSETQTRVIAGQSFNGFKIGENPAFLITSAFSPEGILKSFHVTNNTQSAFLVALTNLGGLDAEGEANVKLTFSEKPTQGIVVDPMRKYKRSIVVAAHNYNLNFLAEDNYVLKVAADQALKFGRWEKLDEIFTNLPVNGRDSLIYVAMLGALINYE
jgi:hypothetical protein